ncbi:MAG: hypothetical protein HC830_08075 [Bacteroidetes bacterium]|nr:hypothetical protein [Bacteroidota bacterium]
MKLPENKDIFEGPIIIRTGEEVGTFYGWLMNGVFPTDQDNRFYPKGHALEGQQVKDPNYTGTVVQLTNGLNGAAFKGGDVWFQDFDKNGIIDENDRTIIGNASPNFFGGISNSFSYKGFKLDIYISYVNGNDIFSNFRKGTESMIFSGNQGIAVDRRWRKPGDITDVPLAIGTDPRQNSRNSTRWLEDGSYVKLRNVTLQYTIPQQITRKVGLNKVDIMVQGANLLTFSNFRGFDPEVNMSDSNFGAGIDNGGYPTARSFNFGINLEF